MFGAFPMVDLFFQRCVWIIYVANLVNFWVCHGYKVVPTPRLWVFLSRLIFMVGFLKSKDVCGLFTWLTCEIFLGGLPWVQCCVFTSLWIFLSKILSKVFCGYFTWLIFWILEWLSMGKRLCFHNLMWISLSNCIACLILFLKVDFLFFYTIDLWSNIMCFFHLGSNINDILRQFSLWLVKLFLIKYNVGFGINFIFHINCLFPFYIFIGIKFNILLWWLIHCWFDMIWA